MGAIAAVGLVRRPVLLATLLATTFALCLPAIAAGEQRIIGGGTVAITDHPYQVQVRTGGGLCGGSIRDATHVVTAAHCVVNEASFPPAVVAPEGVEVGYGDADQTALDTVAVAQVSVFPEYVRDLRSSEFDVALLTLAGPIDLTGPTAKAITFASDAEFGAAFAVGGPSFATGWGLTTQGASSGNRFLKGVSLPLRDHAACRSRYGDVSQGGGYNSAVMLCAGGAGTLPSGNPDTCQGDSGGPLVIDVDADASAVVNRQVGVVSFGDGCGRSGVPGVYAWVQAARLRPYLVTLEPPPPPITPAPNPSVSGTPRVGEILTCDAPPVTGARAVMYVWSVFDPGSRGFTTVQLGTRPTLALSTAAQGALLVCDVRYESDGGFSYSNTPGAAAVGPVASLPVPPVVPRDTSPPLARIGKVACRRGRCTVKVSTSDVGGQVATLSAKLTYRVRRCRKVGGRRRCKVIPRTRVLRPRAVSGGFTITTVLGAGKYTLAVVATDASGNRSTTARKRFTVRRR